MTSLGGMFKRIYGKLKIGWFLFKTVFATNVELKKSENNDGFEYNWKKYSNTVQEFLAKYNINAEDRIDYNNTRKHHYGNFDHLDNPDNPEFKDKSGGDRVLERQGLIYDKDGKTPFNPAEAFDMTYEEYDKYKKKILPRAETKRITYNDIKRFLEKERGGTPKVVTKKRGQRKPAKKTTQGDEKPKPKRKYKPRKPRKPKANDGGGAGK